MRSRLPFLLVVLGLLGLFVAVDAAREETVAVGGESPVTARDFPMQNGPESLSSTWFCAGGTADDERFADHVVIVANEFTSAVSVDVTVYSGTVAAPSAASAADAAADPDAPSIDPDSEAEAEESTTVTSSRLAGPTTTTITVEPATAVRLRLGDIVDAPIASALVEADRGGIAVEHQVTSIHGTDTVACTSAAANEWHFAYGRTTVDARELLVIFNPFPDDAIVDGIFSTETGTREPLRYDGLVVPARSTVALDLGDDVTRREEVAASLRLRSGRAVVDRIVRLNGTGSDRGLTLSSGVATPQPTWVFADGIITEVISEQYIVYNPTETTLEAEIEFIVDDPVTNGVPERVELTLAPGAHEVVDVTLDEFLPSGVGHGAVARSLNGTPFVIERLISARGDTRRGMSVVSGSPVIADNWIFPGGDASDTVDEWLYVMNLDPVVIAEIDVFVLGGGGLVPIEGLQGFEIGASSRAALSLNELTRGQRPVVVRSSEPVMVERGLYTVGADLRGLSNAVGIPDAATAVRPLGELDVVVDVDLGDQGDVDTSTPDDIPVAPDDVELPEPDEVIDPNDLDPDAEQSPTTVAGTTTTGPTGGVPETTPSTAASG